tara:strand:- start:116 stop:355 length:240 start_codon:yes stop_codon:yes gene_type:complete
MAILGFIFGLYGQLVPLWIRDKLCKKEDAFTSARLFAELDVINAREKRDKERKRRESPNRNDDASDGMGPDGWGDPGDM